MCALFNGVCYACDTFKPRCATVTLKLTTTLGLHFIDAESKPLTLCEDCRKTYKGQYRVDPKHKSGGKK